MYLIFGVMIIGIKVLATTACRNAKQVLLPFWTPVFKGD
jgi:hypothetical protein